jgi:hypothetical protein
MIQARTADPIATSWLVSSMMNWGNSAPVLAACYCTRPDFNEFALGDDLISAADSSNCSNHSLRRRFVAKRPCQ